MYDFGIPNDSIKLRRRIFKQMLRPDIDTGYIDGATDHCLLLPFAADQDLNTNERLWLAFLYGMSYSCTTSIRVYSEFSNLKRVSPKKLKAFWTEYKEELWFQPDKRYLKNNNQVVPAIKSLYQLSHGNLQDYIQPMLEQGFDVTYKEILKKWKFFGPMGAYLFFDALYGLCPELYSDPTNLDWKNCGKTVPEGMAHLLGLDEQAQHEEPFDLKRYNKTVNMLVQKSKQPKIIIESVLCAFCKLFKGSRYVGYYADRQLEECNKVAELLKKHCGVDIWSYRAASIPDRLRGEIHDWSGIRKQKCKDFLKYGAIL